LYLHIFILIVTGHNMFKKRNTYVMVKAKTYLFTMREKTTELKRQFSDRVVLASTSCKAHEN